MFYVKETINDALEVKVEINDENVFGHCPVCGRDVSVNLEDVLGDGRGDLVGTSVMCEDCSREMMEVQSGERSEA